MCTNIEIDDKLMAEALAVRGIKTKREAVELGLKTIIRLKQQDRSVSSAGSFTGKAILMQRERIDDAGRFERLDRLFSGRDLAGNRQTRRLVGRGSAAHG